MSRQALIDSRFPRVICAAILSEGQGLATQVHIGIEEGMKQESWIHCDDLRVVEKSALTRWVGSLPPEKMPKLDYALKVALDLPL